MADHFSCLFEIRKPWIQLHAPHVFLLSELSYTKKVQPRCLKVATATSATSALTKLFNKTDELHGLSMEVIPKLKHEQEIRDESILLL